MSQRSARDDRPLGRRYWSLNLRRYRVIPTVSLAAALLAGTLGCEMALTAPGDTTLVLQPSSNTLMLGEKADLEASLRDSNGNAVDGYTVSWLSAEDSVATVDGDGTVTAQATGSTQITATAEKDGQSLSGHVDVNVDDGTSGDSSSFGNEPDGFSEITSRDFDRIDEDGWTDHNPNGEFDLLTDQNAPFSPPDVGRMTYPNGTSGSAGGQTPAKLVRTFSPVRRLYISFWNKVSSNWAGHQSGVNKIGYAAYRRADGTRAYPIIFRLFGIDSGSLNFNLALQHPSLTNINYKQNIGSAVSTRGEWHHYEILLILNSEGSSDGEVHAWVDDTKVVEYTGQQLRGSGESDWDFVQWAPVYGGNPVGETLVETQFMWMDHFYVSGK